MSEKVKNKNLFYCAIIIILTRYIQPPGILNEIFPGEIPDLTSITGSGNQLLGYISTCESGNDHAIFTMLHDAFIDEGPDAYLGFKGGDVFVDDAYYFSAAFFDSLALGNDVDDALEDALDDNNHDINSWEVGLYGDGSTTVVD